MADKDCEHGGYRQTAFAEERAQCWVLGRDGWDGDAEIHRFFLQRGIEDLNSANMCKTDRIIDESC